MARYIFVCISTNTFRLEAINDIMDYTYLSRPTVFALKSILKRVYVCCLISNCTYVCTTKNFVKEKFSYILHGLMQFSLFFVYCMYYFRFVSCMVNDYTDTTADTILPFLKHYYCMKCIVRHSFIDQYLIREEDTSSLLLLYYYCTHKLTHSNTHIHTHTHSGAVKIFLHFLLHHL